MDGPGIWVSCKACSLLFRLYALPEPYILGVKGKEKQTIGELYDLFESVRIFAIAALSPSKIFQLADELWPEEISDHGEQEIGSATEELSLEAQIANEMSSLRKPRREKRFGSAPFLA